MRSPVNRAEAVIVGAGPSGLLAARKIASRNILVTVLEEHQVVGEPKHCAGLISVEGLRRLDIEPSPDFIQHEIKGGRIYSPNGSFLEFTGKRTRAYVIDRTAFDRYLADIALREGAELEYCRRVKELLISHGDVVGVRGIDWEINSKVVIDAEGANSLLAKSMGLHSRDTGTLSGANVELSGVDIEPNMVEVWLGNNIAPGLFAWVIPLGDGAARCGLACRASDIFERLKRFIDRRFSGARFASLEGGLVLTGGPALRTYSNGLLIVGDAAGHTKPTTGGGVVFGGLGAIEAGKTVIDALEVGDFSDDFLQRYQRAWRDSLGRELTSMLALRRFVNRFSDDLIEKLFRSIKKGGLVGVLQDLVEVGDMDMQSHVIRTALKEPRLLRVLASSLGNLAFLELRSLFKL